MNLKMYYRGRVLLNSYMYDLCIIKGDNYGFVI